jgi:hypothetical protein
MPSPVSAAPEPGTNVRSLSPAAVRSIPKNRSKLDVPVKTEEFDRYSWIENTVGVRIQPSHLEASAGAVTLAEP